MIPIKHNQLKKEILDEVVKYLSDNNRYMTFPIIFELGKIINKCIDSSLKNEEQEINECDYCKRPYHKFSTVMTFENKTFHPACYVKLKRELDEIENNLIRQKLDLPDLPEDQHGKVTIS